MASVSALGPRRGRHPVGRFTWLHVHQQVGDAAHPGGERCCVALRVVGSFPTLQVLVQQPAQGADAFFIRAGDVLHQGADQGLPVGLAQCLGGLFIREEATTKVLLVV